MSYEPRTNPVWTAMLSSRILIFFESIITFLAVWWFTASVLGYVDVVSSPILVAEGTYELLLSGEWVNHFYVTFRRILYAFVVTIVVGVALGILLGISDFWKHALRPYVVIGLALPSLFAAIFSAMWFGVSDNTPMVATVVLVVPFIADMVQGSVEDMDADLIEMSGAFDVARPRVIRRVLIHSIMPEVMASIRFAFSVAWKVTTLAEVIIANVGIGYVIRLELNRLSVTGILTWVILFTAVIVFVEYGILRQIEKRVFDWREDIVLSFG